MAPVDWSNEVASVDGVGLFSVVFLIAALSETARTNGTLPRAAGRRRQLRRADRPLMMCRSTPGLSSERAHQRASLGRVHAPPELDDHLDPPPGLRPREPRSDRRRRRAAPGTDAGAGTPSASLQRPGLRTNSQATAAENSASAAASSPISGSGDATLA